jgi:hypothetical protein
LWFFASFRRWGQQETVAGQFRPIDPLSFVYSPRLGAAGNVTTTPDLYENWNTGADQNQETNHTTFPINRNRRPHATSDTRRVLVDAEDRVPAFQKET